MLYNCLIELAELTHMNQLFKIISKLKISFVINDWINTLKYAFFKITEYFINKNQRYQEILLDFKSISGYYDGANLAKLII